MNAILKVPHIENCTAVKSVAEGVWMSPWFLDYKQPTEYLAADGTKRGKTTDFKTLICNSTDCTARALVRQSWLEEVVENELQAGNASQL